MAETRKRRIVVVGSRSVGKSSLAIQYTQHRFESNYNPTIESTFRKPIVYKNVRYETDILDTAGQDEFSLFQQQYAIGVDGYILVYSITNKQSFELIKTLNDKILNATGNDKVPRVIVGNKCDLQDRKVTVEQGQQLANQLDCAFVECSALRNERVEEAFLKLIARIEGDPDISLDSNKECIIL